MVDLPQKNKILQFVESIPSECVYEEEGKHYGKETNPHITLMYGLSPIEENRVKELLTKVPKKISARLGKISKFENSDTPYDVLKIEVNSPHLYKIHEMIRNNFENDYKWPEYNPHVTLSYVKKGTCNEYVGNKTFEGMKFTFENFTYSNGIREQNHKVNMKEYFVGQGGGYGGQSGGPVAPSNWAGTFSSPQTSRRLNLHPDTGITSYMQGNTIVRNALPDTILPQDLEGTPYDPDEIRLGLRAEMKKQEFPDKEKAKQTVLDNLARNRKFYSDLLQYMNSDKGSIMENELKMGIEVEKEHTDDVALATKIAMDHLKEDPKYYTKLKSAGLEECGCGDQGPDVADMEVNPSTLKGIVVQIPNQTANVASINVDGGSQKPLSSSGLGSGGAPKPLSSTEIEAPDPKKIGPNTVATTKTPVMAVSSDPLDHYASKIQSALSMGKF
jgi:2'-5' RNA ligase